MKYFKKTNEKDAYAELLQQYMTHLNLEQQLWRRIMFKRRAG